MQPGHLQSFSLFGCSKLRHVMLCDGSKRLNPLHKALPLPCQHRLQQLLLAKYIIKSAFRAIGTGTSCYQNRSKNRAFGLRWSRRIRSSTQRWARPMNRVAAKKYKNDAELRGLDHQTLGRADALHLALAP